MVNSHYILEHFGTEISDVASIVAQLQGQGVAHGGEQGRMLPLQTSKPAKSCGNPLNIRAVKTHPEPLPDWSFSHSRQALHRLGLARRWIG